MKSRLTVALLVLLSVPTLAAAQTSASDIGDASVTIQNVAITLTNETGLSFGTITPFGRAGSVTVSPQGATTGSSVFVASPGSPSNWSVAGAPGAPYAVTLPSNGSVVVTSGANSMAVNNFTHGGGASPVLSASGTGSFNVGATLTVGANQPNGIYTGTFTVTVAYN